MHSWQRTILALLALYAPLLAAAQAAPEAHQSLDALRATAEQFVRSQARDSQLQVQVGALDERLRLVACRGAPQAALAQGATLGARTTIGLHCANPSWTVYVPVNVKSEVAVLLTRQALARNASIGPADVVTQKRWVPGFAHLYVTDPQSLTGQHVRQPVAPGTAVTVELIAADVLVKRGARVTLLAVSGGFEVRAQGEAVMDSGSGGRVRVQNLASQKIVEGTAETATLVRVN
jgi:flagellar basal body P-ring formation protein FlgA